MQAEICFLWVLVLKLTLITFLIEKGETAKFLKVLYHLACWITKEIHTKIMLNSDFYKVSYNCRINKVVEEVISNRNLSSLLTF